MRTLFRKLLTCMCLWGAACAVQAESITVGGVGGLSPLMQMLADAFVQKYPGHSVHVAMPPLGSAGGLRALAQGKIDLVMSGRPLKDGEVGQAMPWLKTPLVFVTKGGELARGLDAASVADIYSGRLAQWDNGSAIRLIMRGPQESELKVLRGWSQGMDEAVGLALKRKDLPVAETDLDALDLLARINGSFGLTTLGLLRTKTHALNILPVNGQLPSLQLLAKGQYPLVRTFYLVAPPEVKPAVRDFIAFLQSTAAIKLAARYDYAPFTAEAAVR